MKLSCVHAPAPPPCRWGSLGLYHSVYGPRVKMFPRWEGRTSFHRKPAPSGGWICILQQKCISDYRSAKCKVPCSNHCTTTLSRVNQGYCDEQLIDHKLTCQPLGHGEVAHMPRHVRPTVHLKLSLYINVICGNFLVFYQGGWTQHVPLKKNRTIEQIYIFLYFFILFTLFTNITYIISLGKKTFIFKGGGGEKSTWVHKYVQTVMLTYKFIHPSWIFTYGLKAIILTIKVHFYQLFNSAASLFLIAYYHSRTTPAWSYRPRLNGRKENNFNC